MTKICLVTDTHFGYKKGDEKMAGYMARFFHETFFPEIDKRGIKDIIHLGDLFDPRQEMPTHTFDEVLNNFIKPCQKRKLWVHEILGNHDTRYKNTNKINTPKVILGRDYAGEGAKYFNLIENEFTEVTIGGLTIGLVPWITPENHDAIISALETTEATVIMGHFEIEGAKMDRMQTAKHGLSSTLFARFDRVFSGHFHHKSRYSNIDYLGAPYQMTWIDCDDAKGFHIFDTETLELEFVENPLTMFNKIVFDGKTEYDPELFKGSNVRVIVENNENPAAVNKFISEIEKYAIDVKPIDNPVALAKAEKPTEQIDIQVEDTMDIIKAYIASKTTPAIAERANAKLEELYRKAVL